MRRFLTIVPILLACWGILPAAASAEEYRLAPGDLISIAVFGEPDLSMDRVRVPAGGVVSYPLLGEIRVEGFTAQALAQNLTNRLLNGYLRDPKVTVTVIEYRPFYVTGAVESPGGYGYKESMTVEKAITEAGGFAESALRDQITVMREGDPDKTPRPVGLSDSVNPGDVVTVKGGASANAFFYVYGEVGTPGSYTFREGLTVEKAIVLAGGFGARASKRKISVTREGSPPERLESVELSTALQPGDVITVGASLF
jgi:polysaccharide export outer membrane protein